MTLPFDRLLHADEMFSGAPIGKAPGLTQLVGKVAHGDPAAGFVRMAMLRPAIRPPPHEVVELGKQLATNPMAMVVCPTP
jgi:hypothetical protein